MKKSLLSYANTQLNKIEEKLESTENKRKYIPRHYDYLYFENDSIKELSKILINNEDNIKFTIKNIKYASLNFDLIIENSKKVMEFFENNEYLLKLFLKQYIPDSFCKNFNITNGVNMMTTEIDPSLDITSLKNSIPFSFSSFSVIE